MENTWYVAAVWIGLALIASVISMRTAISVALIEICVGVIGGNFLGLDPKVEWISFLASFGAILLTFLAGAEIEPEILRKYGKESLGIGLVSFLFPFLGAMAYAYVCVKMDPRCVHDLRDCLVHHIGGRCVRCHGRDGTQREPNSARSF